MKDSALYEVAAQVIPVLFFALLFQLGWFEQSDKKPSARLAFFDLAIIVLAAVGELVCITALAEDRTPTDAEKTVVVLAIGFLFLPAIIRAARPRLAAIGKALPWTQGVGAILTLFVTLAFPVLVYTDIEIMPIVGLGALVFVILVFAGGGIAEDVEKGRLRLPRRKRPR